MEIKDLDPAFLPSVTALFARVVAHMRAAGIDQWDEIYPDAAVLEADLRSGAAFGLFAVENGLPGELRAYVTLNGEQDAAYGTVPWSEQNGRPLVIHRLCVDPVFRGKGAAKRLVAFAEAHAARFGHTSIRLDAFSLNPAALSLYDSLGYDWRGEVTFRKGLFRCYEKILEPGGAFGAVRFS